MQSFISTVLALIAATRLTTAITLDVNSADSIKEASSTLAFGLMSWYSNNQSDTEATLVGTFPGEPWYRQAAETWQTHDANLDLGIGGRPVRYGEASLITGLTQATAATTRSSLKLF